MNKKKIKKLLILLLVTITIVGVGSLLAFLTDTDTETNVFTVGKVDIELLEPNWNELNGEDILPGQPISKDPKIKNIGNNPAYVYMKVVNPIVNLTNGEGPLFSYTVNNGWTQLSEVEQCGYKAITYYYNTSINPNASTTTLFDSVTINDFSGEIGEEQLLDIYAYGIQSTYLQSGSTVTSLFTSSFKSDLSDTNGLCPFAYDCDNNPMLPTAPSNLNGLAKIMAKNAYLDNGKSPYVTSCNGVSFNDISSDTNGKGIYEIASTKNDVYPIYYYRGAVDNNNVKFAGFCWKAIRTTDTGGVKLIYNGSPDGSGNCTNTTGYTTTIGNSSYHPTGSLAYVGYMYGKVYSSTRRSNINTPYVYGNDVTYSNGAYTLIDTKTTTGTWSNDYNTLNNHHYTCFSTENTCANVYYITYTYSSSGAYYILLTNGKKVDDALDEMFNASDINTTNSTAKTKVDNWYSNNLSSYTNYIEDTIYCNDRRISDLGGWNPDGGSTRNYFYFSSYARGWVDYTPTLTCSRKLDSFTVSSSLGNGALTYPIGLITIDEAMYAGGKGSETNNTYYLYSGNIYWFMSPGIGYSDGGGVLFIANDGALGTHYTTGTTNALRPVISLKATDIVESGDGTSTNPYVIKTS